MIALMKFLLVCLTVACVRSTNYNETVSTDESTDDVPPVQKIIGGFPVAAGTYPFYAMMQTFSGSFFCGSSLVTPEFILTAAHCVNGRTSSSIKFLIGALCPYESGNCGQYGELKYAWQIYKHPQYNASTDDHDFALVRLTSRSTIQPIAMDNGTISPGYTDEKRNLYVTGTHFHLCETKR
jgi:secreted trypsin-like serine protease